MPRSPGLSRRKRLSFAFAMLVMTAGAAEAVVRATKPRTDLWALTGRELSTDPKASWANVDAFCAYRARPGSYSGESYSGIKTVNSDGFISTPDVPLEKEPRTIRIAFLGESSCAGTGYTPLLGDRETWPWLVMERLRATFPERKFDFLNAAASGFTTFETYGRLWSRVRFYRPDLIVVYHGWNDLGLLYPGELENVNRWRVQDDGNWALMLRRGQIEPSPFDHVIWPSQLLSKLRLKLATRPRAALGDSRPMAADCDLKGLAVFRENLQLMLATARTLGIETYVCKQATLLAPGLDPSLRRRCEQFSFPYEAHLRAYAGYRAMIDQEVPPDRVIDVSQLDGRADLFDDHVHVNPAGAREVARIVAAPLESWLRERGPPLACR